MITLFLGLAFTYSIMLYSVGTSNLSTYVNTHSIILVCGGTVSIYLLSTPLNVVRALWRNLKSLIEPDELFSDYREELISLAKAKKLSRPSRNDLINYSLELWQQGIDRELFIVLLSQKRQDLSSESLESVQSLKNLAKYPPALGMTGTVMSMVTLFSQLGSSKDSIGPALALGMTATFFGLIIANGLIMPISDRVQVHHLKNQKLFTNIYQVLLLINQGHPQHLITEEVKHRAA